MGFPKRVVESVLHWLTAESRHFKTFVATFPSVHSWYDAENCFTQYSKPLMVQLDAIPTQYAYINIGVNTDHFALHIHICVCMCYIYSNFVSTKNA